MSSYEPYYVARDELVAGIVEDLVGPSDENEVLSDYPLERYVSGILFPQKENEPHPTQDDSSGSERPDSETDGDDAPVSMAHVKYPSSMGLTFAVDTGIEAGLSVIIDAARYEAVDPSDSPSGNEGESSGGEEDDGDDSHAKARGDFRRVPLSLTSQTIDATVPRRGERIRLADGLTLFVRVREAEPNGMVTVTLALVNEHTVTTGFRDEWSFFQPSLQVVSASRQTFPFVDRWSEQATLEDDDLRAFQLLYRHAHHYATGHGCAVTWEEPGTPATGLRTTFVPFADLHLADANPDVGNVDLSMSTMAHGGRDGVLHQLRTMAATYKEWIAARNGEADQFTDPDLRATAGEHIDRCREALGRIDAGIDVLADGQPEDNHAWRAFQLANLAMLRQRARGEWIAAGSPPPGPPGDAGGTWRPFQMAFILLCLQGLADRDSEDRQLADLLWFPTGGGKTEAYLGLIAFTIFHRRLSTPNSSDGVVALMRYTLRLLTIQQFQRATMLVCACETIRREHAELGQTEISIGLWVGGKGAPNRLAEASTALKKLRTGAPVSEGNPVQLHACPWCGVPLDHGNYFLNRGRTHLIIACKNDFCDFSRHLPAYVVDEEIYRDRPTLVIATVDKFAGVAWREQTHRLFNLETEDLPPDLIVQDELHLISGPLGTITGLYETAIDAACTVDGTRPKVVASTATIRRAGPQTRGLFDREVRQFPPPGLDARDSFFAVEAERAGRPTRRYVGVMAPGSSHTTLMIRTYARLMQGAAELDVEDAVRDPYWTLVGYFNSLRVLGGARIAVLDDVDHRIGLLARAHGRDRRNAGALIELTSRQPSSAIPQHLEEMAIGLPGDALDTILATNMISVGVDIDRLGLMAVMGQPQSTSEYIQATSRVGRQHPGLVVTILNAARSRDRSHYEAFVPFHRSIYRQVEAASVTPFSPRARDRALHAVYIALARLLIPALRPNQAAADVGNHLPELEGLEKLILERVHDVDASELTFVETQLGEIRDHWLRRAAEGPLVYSKRDEPHISLLVAASEEGGDAFPTLWSMRDVDQVSNLYLIG